CRRGHGDDGQDGGAALRSWMYRDSTSGSMIGIAYVPQDGLSATGPLPPGHNQDMSKGAEMTDLPGPTFPLKAPGTAVVHAGARQKPRIVSVPARCIENTVELTGGTDIFDALAQSLLEYEVTDIIAHH